MVRNGTEWYRAKSRILENVNTLIVSVDSLQFFTKKRVGFLRLFSLNTVLLIRKEALNNDSERYYVQVYCTPSINKFQEHLLSYCFVISMARLLPVTAWPPITTVSVELFFPQYNRTIPLVPSVTVSPIAFTVCEAFIPGTAVPS